MRGWGVRARLDGMPAKPQTEPERGSGTRPGWGACLWLMCSSHRSSASHTASPWSDWLSACQMSAPELQMIQSNGSESKPPSCTGSQQSWFSATQAVTLQQSLLQVSAKKAPASRP